MASYVWQGTEKETSKITKGQVWQVTHDGGGNLLPHRLRSFISFSFGGKNIEDFDLIACCEGDSLSRRGYADFEDLTTTYDIIDGQYYHGTHYKPNTLSLRLVTDGIDEKKLNEFLHWFAGGKIRELILAEHPNRAIMARVAAPPELDVLPFEKKINVSIGPSTFETSTTVYRGFISLELVADFPFWYAKQNILLRGDDDVLYTETNIFSDENRLKEALKIVYEDTVPIIDMVKTTMHFGIDTYAIVGQMPYSLIAGPMDINNPTVKPSGWDSTIPGYFMQGNEYWIGARIHDGVTYYGKIDGADISNDTGLTGEISSDNKDYKFFYGGTAPSPTILSFDINLKPVKSSPTYIDCIANSYVTKDSLDYSYIKLTSQHVKEFDFTTPNIITSWNKAKYIFSQATANTNSNDIIDTLRDQVMHPAVRAWAVGMVNWAKQDGTNINTTTGVIGSDFSTWAYKYLADFFRLTHDDTWSGGTWADASFVFNAELGTAQGTFTYWKVTNSSNNVFEIYKNTDVAISNTIPSTLAYSTNDITFAAHTEDVGDMLRSNWLFIEDHNEFDNNGYIKARTAAHPEYSHVLEHNARGNLKNLKIEYKNMYL